jgi:hypothetical protein
MPPARDMRWGLPAGHWAQKIQHPSAGVTKEYLVTCAGAVTRRQLEAVAAGGVVDGAMVVPLAVAPVVDQPGDRSRLRVVVAEGRKHEARASARWQPAGGSASARRSYHRQGCGSVAGCLEHSFRSVLRWGGP